MAAKRRWQIALDYLEESLKLGRTLSFDDVVWVNILLRFDDPQKAYNDEMRYLASKKAGASLEEFKDHIIVFREGMILSAGVRLNEYGYIDSTLAPLEDIVVEDGGRPAIGIFVPEEDAWAQVGLINKTLSDSKLHPVVKATKVYQDIASLHLFNQGNGRVARLILNYILRQAGYPPCYFNKSFIPINFWCVDDRLEPEFLSWYLNVPDIDGARERLKHNYRHANHFTLMQAVNYVRAYIERADLLMANYGYDFGELDFKFPPAYKICDLTYYPPRTLPLKH